MNTNVWAGRLEREAKPDCSPVLRNEMHILLNIKNTFYNGSGSFIRDTENHLYVTYSLYAGIYTRVLLMMMMMMIIIIIIIIMFMKD
jgi:hypothetical protein